MSAADIGGMFLPCCTGHHSLCDSACTCNPAGGASPRTPIQSMQSRSPRALLAQGLMFVRPSRRTVVCEEGRAQPAIRYPSQAQRPGRFTASCCRAPPGASCPVPDRHFDAQETAMAASVRSPGRIRARIPQSGRLGSCAGKGKTYLHHPMEARIGLLGNSGNNPQF
jgi:hypothetical protein